MLQMVIYKKIKCINCGNIYASRRKAPRCIKGSLSGCGSTKAYIMEEYDLNQELKAEEQTETEQKTRTEDEEDDDLF